MSRYTDLFKFFLSFRPTGATVRQLSNAALLILNKRLPGWRKRGAAKGPYVPVSLPSRTYVHT
jgi:hypothetical protein